MGTQEQEREAHRQAVAVDASGDKERALQCRGPVGSDLASGGKHGTPTHSGGVGSGMLGNNAGGGMGAVRAFV